MGPYEHPYDRLRSYEMPSQALFPSMVWVNWHTMGHTRACARMEGRRSLCHREFNPFFLPLVKKIEEFFYAGEQEPYDRPYQRLRSYARPSCTLFVSGSK